MKALLLLAAVVWNVLASTASSEYVFALHDPAKLMIGTRVVGEVQIVDCLKVLERQGTWIRVECKMASEEAVVYHTNGVKGWIRANQVQSLDDRLRFVDRFALERNIPEAWNLAGWTHMLRWTSDGFRKAITCFTRATEMAPADETAFFYRGTCWLYLGLYDKALKDFEESRMLNPSRWKFDEILAGTQKLSAQGNSKTRGDGIQSVSLIIQEANKPSNEATPTPPQQSQVTNDLFSTSDDSVEEQMFNWLVLRRAEGESFASQSVKNQVVELMTEMSKVPDFSELLPYNKWIRHFELQIPNFDSLTTEQKHVKIGELYENFEKDRYKPRARSAGVSEVPTVSSLQQSATQRPDVAKQDKSVVGTWSAQGANWTFKSDGTYMAYGEGGTWTTTENGIVVRNNRDKSGGPPLPFTWVDGELVSSGITLRRVGTAE